MLTRATLLLALGFSLGLSAAEHTKHTIPNPTEQDIHALFGERLARGDRAENLLLLAIAFDQQSKDSPTRNDAIGIPYIATAGPGYWVRLLQQERGNLSLDTLVNNALILTYAKDQNVSDDVRRKAATQLLSRAAHRGYWPAQVFLAERQLLAWRRHETPILMTESEGKATDDAKRAFEYLSDCTRIRFAPCQFQLGFWYLQDATTRETGLELLRAGVEITRRDPRYASSKDTLQDMQKALNILALPSSNTSYRKLLKEWSSTRED